MERTLNKLNPKESGRVKKILGEGQLRKKLLDMGIIPGTTVEVVKVAPLGDPIDIKVRGYHLSLRKEEAALIYVYVEEDKLCLS
ncbi:MAG: ferrous iron transport protein A [Nitrospinae bacterium]|nr:ferrous iron transport protein A [Nitrospinota bacterium]